ncbi:GGDEF domain-containing protein [Saccharopolyspora sp. TS4A08]|uniref:GGDEF domain-containing protein n=1 Tax=Saccharopolyspora ipomoeae TaxID=3042027 RepID=A0ABT6PPA9_9PSEU|nr:GGDEF domain-containing protein [Saccharopolyspora sp. TS4A08]MDI2029836.1 GGDEF domain-containing protein [Saccharopolyspora sp. TS4A08]
MFAKSLALAGAAGTVALGWRAHRLHARLHTDELTGLANRAALNRAFARTQRRAAAGELVGLLMCDVDRFKQINDTHGHRTGDHVLRSIATDLSRLTTGTDELAVRLSGDEFVVLLPDLADVRDAEGRARHYRDALACNRVIDGQRMQLTVSVGAAVDTATTTTLSALAGHADARMYELKRHTHLTSLPTTSATCPTTRRRDLPKEAA